MFRKIQLLVLVILSSGSAYAEQLKVGALAELTGAFSRNGNDCRLGYEIARKQSGDYVRLFFGDNQNDPKIGLSEFRRLVLEGVQAVVTSRSPVALAINPLSLQQKIPLIGIVAHPKFVQDNPYAVRVFPAVKEEANLLASHLNSLGETSIGIISLEDDYFLAYERAFENGVGAQKVKFSQTVTPNDQDFGTLLLQLKAKSPSAIFLNVGPSQLVQLVTRIRELKIDARLYGNFTAGLEDVRKALRSASDGIVFVELDYEKPEFLREVTERTGTSIVSPISYSCYLGITFAARLGKIAEEKKIPLSDAVSLVTKITTLDGDVEILDREAKIDVTLKKIVDGRVIKLSR